MGDGERARGKRRPVAGLLSIICRCLEILWRYIGRRLLGECIERRGIHVAQNTLVSKVNHLHVLERKNSKLSSSEYVFFIE